MRSAFARPSSEICTCATQMVFTWSLHTTNSPAYVAARMSDPLLRPPPDAPLGRLAITKEVVQVADIRTLPSRDHPFVAPGVKAGYRTVLAIPLLKDDELIGAFTVIRQKVQAFTEKQIALLQNFAAQAVIAIENTRLLNELRESLEQQTATSEVLGVISSSPGKLEPVFQAMLENAARICEAEFGTLFLREGDVFRFAAEVGTPPELAEFNRRRKALVPTPGGILERAMHTRQVIHTADAAAEPAPGASSKLGGARSTVCVPMLKDDQLLGVIIIFRQEVRPFTDKQIALVQNFAAQAVIAIENARLLNELRQTESPAAAELRPPMCSRSSAAQRSIFRRSSTRWSKSASQHRDAYDSDYSFCTRADISMSKHIMARLNWISPNGRLDAAAITGRPTSIEHQSRSTIRRRPPRSSQTAARWRCASAIGRSWLSRCLGSTRLSAYLRSAAPR